MTTRLQTLALVTGLVLLPISASAHHSWPVSRAKLVTVKGTVTAISWQNPHPMFALDVADASGRIEKWNVGGPSINRMEPNGWSRNTIKIGDVITGIGYQFADGARIIRLEKVLLADGKELFVYGRR